jgi:hypothetical protein
LESERRRYQKRKAEGKIQNIQTMSTRDQRSLRRKWKLDKRKQRAQKAEHHDCEKDILTPPQSPALIEQPFESHQRKRGRKKLRREEKRAYRRIAAQQSKLESLVKKLQRTLKRQQPSDISGRDDEASSSTYLSPASKATQLLKGGNMTKIRRELTVGFSLGEELKKKLKCSNQTLKERKTVRKILTGQVMKKYKLLSKARTDILKSQCSTGSSSCNPKDHEVTDLSSFKKRQQEIARCVREFYNSDENSTAAAGKKETVTKRKEKKQKRYLCDTMMNLHAKFQAENPGLKVQYTR